MTPADRGPTAVLLSVALGAMASLGLPVLSQAPNRLLSGQGMHLHQAWGARPGLAAAAVAAMVLAALALFAARKERRLGLGALLLALPAWVFALLLLAATVGARADAASNGLARTALASGFWLTALMAWLAASECLRQLEAPAWQRVAYGVAVLSAFGLLVRWGALDSLSLLKEYSQRADDFARGLREHLAIVAATVAATSLVGLPLGVTLARHRGWQPRVFAVLNLVQTVPSIALFGVLMAALAVLVQHYPVWGRLGLKGVGMTPAVIALTLYSLLPLVRNVCAGLEQVPQGVREAALGMGMSRIQRLWRVELPLALPVMWSGYSVMVVQAIGLTAVAALIGAGGLGALMFEGLFSSALDLVMLAVIPIVMLSWAAQALGAALAGVPPVAEPRP